MKDLKDKLFGRYSVLTKTSVLPAGQEAKNPFLSHKIIEIKKKHLFHHKKSICTDVTIPANYDIIASTATSALFPLAAARLTIASLSSSVDFKGDIKQWP